MGLSFSTLFNSFALFHVGDLVTSSLDGVMFTPYLFSLRAINNRQIRVCAISDVIIKPLPNITILLTD